MKDRHIFYDSFDHFFKMIQKIIVPILYVCSGVEDSSRLC